MQTRFPQVYAIGDVVGIPLSMGKPLPKAGVFAHAQGEVVANNIAVAITGQGKNTQFDGTGQCFVEIGDGRAGIGKTNFYAEPRPQAQMRPPGYFWHFGKVMFEKHWLWKWF
jgi:sulfide:quinone oxidoreductase